MERPTSQVTVRFAPDVPNLEALGATSADDFWATPPRVVTAARAQRIGDAWRVPLPGTPDEHGRQHERPRGAGTGFLILRRWRSASLKLARARLTTPRSTSLAAREWNLACHLQANGVVTAPLVAFGERGSSLASPRSFLIVRELEGFVPLSRWLAETTDAHARRRGLKSLGLALASLFRSDTWLPRTTLDNLHIARGDGEDCVALQLFNLRGEQELLRERGLSRARLPAVAFTELEDGAVVPRLSLSSRLALLRQLTEQAATPPTRRDLARVARGVFASRDERRAAVAEWS